MPDGELRRPPQLWEQRLARTTAVLGVGISSSGGDATAIVPPQPAPGAGGGTEPAPVLPPPGAFIKPSTPTLVGSLQGINVLWDGLNSAGDLWPYDTSWVEVHMATSGTGFTAGSATLKGRLARPGAFFVGGLTAGTTYYFKLRGADPAGNYTDASDAASGQTGLTTSSDYGTATIGTGAVSFNARTIGGVTNTVGSATPSSPLQGDVWLDTSPGTAIIHKVYNGGSWTTNAWGSASIAAGQITALQIAAGAITAGAIAAGAVTTDKLTAGTISGFYISGGTIAGGYISGGTISTGFMTGGTVEGALIKSAGSGQRVEIQSSQVSLIDSTGTSRGAIYADSTNGMLVGGGSKLYMWGDTVYIGPTLGPFVTITSGAIAGSTLDISGAAVDMLGVYNNDTTGLDSVGINSSGRLRRLSSRQALKYDITPLAGTLSPVVDPDRVSDIATVNTNAVLDLAVTEFSVIDGGEPTDRRVLGFIADDVADKLPIAATYYDDGTPAGVLDTAILAAVLAVVQEQRATINDLRTRIEALEA